MKKTNQLVTVCITYHIHDEKSLSTDYNLEWFLGWSVKNSLE